MAEINRNYTHYIEKIRKKKIIPLIKKINNIPATIDFNLHIWWAKKPNNIISTLIKELSNENEIILDPFIGSGVSAIEALKLNRKIIAFDISKLAIFITKSIINCYNKSKFTNLFDKIVLNLQNKVYGTEHYKITDLYLTRCPICGKKSQFLYMVYDLDSPKWLRLMCTHNNRLKNIKKTFNSIFFFHINRKICFSQQFSGEHPKLWIMNTDGSDLKKLTNHGAEMPSFSPDGEWIVYTRTDNNDGSLCLIRPDGSEKHRLTDWWEY